MTRTAARISMVVGFAGAAGALCRYFVSMLGEQGGADFPWSTLAVNLTGCFLLAFLFYSERITGRWSAQTRAALSTGFLGSFTTFSALSAETVMLLDQDRLWQAGAYLFLSICLGWLLAAAGCWTAGKDNARFRLRKEVRP
ncbi:fluoride efflux transporter CrcB [Xylanibacillus composti]|uniref:Fluoride-specific ion channel FluC n=1 Tax=Xylanibacillus composti TaxID=1572762 RepID=A0A8J4M1X1_9BACL|nr:fluoride efflux transporter CrcB [Xylanibacillus composti]MDT9724183.1 fluoride efflux transporter CrcB [Xylanibacillus composti]GIQ68302.1 hypothetical protein XYCOK13_11260 [Xylanibacillus composti]